MTETYPFIPCLRSGMCCKSAPCGYGESISDTERGCRFLETKEIINDTTTIYQCGKYADIVGQPGADLTPAFGAGCCQSLFNTNRAAILRLVRQGAVHLPFGAGGSPAGERDEP